MESLGNAIDRVVRKILLVLMAVETVVVIAAVIARYVFNSSFPWSEEAARAILTWIVFLGASCALKGHELVAMESVRDTMSDRKLLAIRLLSDACVIVFLIFLSYASFRLISLTHRQVYPVTGYPLWIAYLAIPISSMLMIYHSLVRMIRLIRGQEPLRQEFVLEEVA
jgi:TRAP-type C4-dicarboxylate transport system permease small subunit